MAHLRVVGRFEKALGHRQRRCAALRNLGCQAGRGNVCWIVEALITASARKHGVTDDDMLHAFNHPISYADLDEGFVMIIGRTSSAELIELGSIDTDPRPVIVHAMTARRKYSR